MAISGQVDAVNPKRMTYQGCSLRIETVDDPLRERLALFLRFLHPLGFLPHIATEPDDPLLGAVLCGS
jgi:hypothetical protein